MNINNEHAVREILASAQAECECGRCPSSLMSVVTFFFVDVVKDKGLAHVHFWFGDKHAASGTDAFECGQSIVFNMTDGCTAASDTTARSYPPFVPPPVPLRTPSHEGVRARERSSEHSREGNHNEEESKRPKKRVEIRPGEQALEDHTAADAQARHELQELLDAFIAASRLPQRTLNLYHFLHPRNQHILSVVGRSLTGIGGEFDLEELAGSVAGSVEGYDADTEGTPHQLRQREVEQRLDRTWRTSSRGSHRSPPALKGRRLSQARLYPVVRLSSPIPEPRSLLPSRPPKADETLGKRLGETLWTLELS
ncbi:hypothetical protein BDZ45DRAFT_751972 [Acephala macrosclerotiorum]|nr:hypothetical protein BDZ45DRAFT_751972 [Acephala macrosclerotiorum]